MTIDKWQAFETSFEGDPTIEFFLQARQGSKPYIELPAPPGAKFEPGDFSNWAVMFIQQLVAVTGQPIDAGIFARKRAGKPGVLEYGRGERRRFYPATTPFMEIRKQVQKMDREERAMWVKAVAVEEGQRTAKNVQADDMERKNAWSELPYAWNRVAAACDKACDLEAFAEGNQE